MDWVSKVASSVSSNHPSQEEPSVHVEESDTNLTLPSKSCRFGTGDLRNEEDSSTRSKSNINLWMGKKPDMGSLDSNLVAISTIIPLIRSGLMCFDMGKKDQKGRLEMDPDETLESYWSRMKDHCVRAVAAADDVHAKSGYQNGGKQARSRSKISIKRFRLSPIFYEERHDIVYPIEKQDRGLARASSKKLTRRTRQEEGRETEYTAPQEGRR